MWHVLIVDDDRIVLDGLKRFMNWETLGFAVMGVASSAKEAIELVRDENVDVLMTDIMMPQEDGFQLIEEALLVNPSIKTVILSGYPEFDFARKAIQLGTIDYLTKPVDFQELARLFARLGGLLEEDASKRRRLIHSKLEILQQDAAAEPSPAAEKPHGQIIEHVLHYISLHYMDNISLPLLSEVVYVHPVYLSKLFKEKTGDNFLEYLSGVRVEKAKELLGDLSLRIYDVCQMVGYTSPKHFSKIFKDVVGVSPKDYRNRLHGATQGTLS